MLTFRAMCNNDIMSFSWDALTGRNYMTAYCPDWVEHWSMYGPLSTYRDSRGLSTPVLRGTVHITQIALSFMTTSVLRELAYGPYILGNDVLGRLLFSYPVKGVLFIMEQKASLTNFYQGT